ncbi:MAG TPA: ribosome silencing factor [Steroidobacteraceae bacterium]|nr:ribosome silencing factor [Steroidobacteraceae bacterium]HQX79327.1 ribosome silencing factor [Steroidobacteraceae bacterium]
MTTAKRPRRSAPRTTPLEEIVTTALDDMKAVNVRVLDVRGLTDIADTFVIASGNSDRHVRSIAERVIQKARAAGIRTHGIEGERDSEWVLVDLTDVIVHVMLPRTREFYGLERLWEGDGASVPAKAAAPRRTKTGARRAAPRAAAAHGARPRPARSRRAH